MNYEKRGFENILTAGYETTIGIAMSVGPSVIAYNVDLFGSPTYLVAAGLLAIPGGALIGKGVKRIYGEIKDIRNGREEKGQLEEVVDSEQ